MIVPSSLPLVFCFSGQGSQYHHMADELMREHPVFAQWMQIGDEVVRARHGFSLLKEVYDTRRRAAEPFDRLETTHPSLFLVQFAMAKVLLHHGLRPDALFGISLGEAVAMTVAGMVSFEPMLLTVSDQPALYRRTCRPGGMTAVLGPLCLPAEVTEVGACELAGVNADSHFVLSGLVDALEAAEAALWARDVPFQRLPVPFAFHSRWIEPARGAVCAAIPFRLRSPTWPCWSSCTGGTLDPNIPDLFWQLAREPMRVKATLDRLEAAGGAVYVDLSPSGTIAALLRLVLAPGSPSRIVPILSPFGGAMKNLTRALEGLGALATFGAFV